MEPLGPALPGDDPAAQTEGEDGGDGHHHHREPVDQHLSQGHVPEGPGHHGHLGQGEDGEEGLEQPVVDRLGPQPQGEDHRADHQQPLPPAGGDPSAQQPQQHGGGQGEEQGKPHAREG